MSGRVPTKVDGYGPLEMLIEWGDGESYAVTYAEVRFRCPCAHCVDEASGRRKIRREDVQPGVKPLQAEQVGNYALKFWWTDRHTTGIYSFDTLDEACREAGRLIGAGTQPLPAGAAAPQPQAAPKAHACGCGTGGCGR